AVRVCGDDGRAFLELEHLAKPSDVGAQRALRELWRSDVEAVGLEAFDHPAPAGPIGPGAVHQNDVWPVTHPLTPLRVSAQPTPPLSSLGPSRQYAPLAAIASVGRLLCHHAT